MKPYYEADGITIYHGDCLVGFSRVVVPSVLVTDPPYGIAYQSGKPGMLARSIHGDSDSGVRDCALRLWTGIPALVFGTWRVARPEGTKMVLVWDTKGALGMGDLSLPWKPAHQEIYVIGGGFVGRRTSDVLCFPPVQSQAHMGRVHPHEKPVGLMMELISKCPLGVVLDPFMGSGSTLVAAKNLGRKAVGIEIEVRYCEIAAERLSQTVLAL